MPTRRGGARVLGPYEDKQRRGVWRLVIRDRDGERSSPTFPSKEAADKEKALITKQFEREAVGDRTVEQALTAYLEHQRLKGNKPGSVTTTEHRLRRFFGDTRSALRTLTAAQCAKFYKALWEKREGAVKKPQAVDTHRNTLAEVKTFLGWCVEKRWLTSNPCLELVGVGARKKGKEQLHLDEARRWVRFAREHAADGQNGAIAALTAFLMALRASEICDRLVRDLDDDAQLLWIPDSKTKAGRRRVEVPEVLQPYLRRLAQGRGAQERLFGKLRRETVRRWVIKLCREARVTEVTTHSLRGLHASLAEEQGITGHLVAQALGHESITTTHEHYATREAVEKGRQSRFLKVLEGGKHKRKLRNGSGRNRSAEETATAK